MTKTLAVLTAMLAGALLAGCATHPRGGDDSAVARGRAYAQRACGQCHSLDAGPSPWREAPPFRAIRRSLNQILYERRVAELTGRHMSMPPMEVSDAELQDLAAYVRSLK